MSTIEAHSCVTKAASALENLNVSGEDRILLALSGGPDSTALLAVLSELRRHTPFHLACAYADHGLRGESELHAEHMHIDWCARRFSCPVYRKLFTPGVLQKYASAKGCGIEAAARRFRYGFLRRTARENSFDYIAFAHTSDDQVETVLMRIFQGAGPEGLRGMPAGGNGLLRPFLKVCKEEILDFLSETGIPFISDSSNSSVEYRRNALRHILMPAAEEVFPGFEKAVSGFREKMAEITAFLQDETGKMIPWKPVPAPAGVVTPVSGPEKTGLCTEHGSYTAAPRILRKQALYRCVDSFCADRERRIPERFILDLDRGICEKANNGLIAAAYGSRFSRYGNILYAEADIVFPEKKGYLLCVEHRETDLIFQSGFQIQKTLLSSNMDEAVWLYDYKEMYPLLVRSWRSGDSISGKNGTKEIRKIFQEWNVPDNCKWEIPIIEDSEGIRAIAGSFFGFPDRYRTPLRNDTKIDTNNILVFSYSKDGNNL